MSLYTKPGTLPGSHVSFDRPYDTAHQGPTWWELSAVHFLERHGYDVSYTTDVDTDRDPASLLRHALVLTLGHDEYWTNTMRNAFEAARDAGVNLGFLGANTGYWQIRYEDARRTLVEYRHPELDPEPDPALKTTTFRELTPPRPECTLLGVGYGQLGDSERLHRERQRPRGLVVSRHRLHTRQHAARSRRLRVGRAAAGLRRAVTDGVLPLRASER